MTVFLILAALLAAGTLLFVLPPLLGREARGRSQRESQRQTETALAVLREQLAELEVDRQAGQISEQEYRRASTELEQRALEEGRTAEGGEDLRPARGWAAMLAVGVPALAMAVYLMVGEPGGVEPQRAAPPPAEAGQITPERMAELVDRLVDRLEADPSDETGWIMLARSYVMMGDAQAAQQAWARIGDDVPDNARVLADWGDLLVAAQGGDFSGEPQRIIDRALVLDPDNFKARALAGASAFEREAFADAARHWQRLLEQVPVEDEAYRSVLSSVNQARERAGLDPLPVDVAGLSPPDDAQTQGVPLSGTVRVHESLRGALDDQATVFVFVGAPDGGMPFAAIRLSARDLPAVFDFAAAPRMNEAPLPEKVVVRARVSADGDPQAQAGDLEGESKPVPVDAENIELVIDRTYQD